MVSRQSLFFVGGVRSGKSALAQQWAERHSLRRLYVATANADDAEMADRIARHKAARGVGWQTVEAPLDPVSVLKARCAAAVGTPVDVVLLDCVSLWIANLIGQGMHEDSILERVEALAILAVTPGPPLALVSLEAGLGMVPLSAVGRAYQDTLGLANQRLARACATVIHVSYGLPVLLKGRLPEELC